MLNVKTYLASKQKRVESELDRLLTIDDCPPIVKAMRYSLLGGGKRIRPILCLAAAAAVGGDEDDVMSAACALEMVHTYSLIHDDLPGMDDDRLRRGRATCHVQFNEATAILAGDGLLTLAFEVLAKEGLKQNGGAAKWLVVIQKLSAASGFNGMIEGQMRDMAFEGKRLSVEQLESMHMLKTGRMIEAALSIGAHLGNGSEKQQTDLAEFGRKIGLAFQVADDLLNVHGDPRNMGKAVGTDLIRGKNTYCTLLGLAESKRFANTLVEQALHTIASFDNKADPLRGIARYIIDRNR